jgi:hypothetical protein
MVRVPFLAKYRLESIVGAVLGFALNWVLHAAAQKLVRAPVSPMTL